MKNINKKKRNNTLLIILIIILLVIVLLILLLNLNKKPTIILKNGKTINLQLAVTEQEQETGLMYRKSLDENSGMLFIYQDEQIRSFWMKNTLIPLDIIFIDSNNRIIDIQSAEPCKKNPCIDYISKYPAKYVLETNQGYSEKNNISIGDKIELINI